MTWIPAFAGMTESTVKPFKRFNPLKFLPLHVIPAKAGIQTLLKFLGALKPLA